MAVDDRLESNAEWQAHITGVALVSATLRSHLEQHMCGTGKGYDAMSTCFVGMHMGVSKLLSHLLENNDLQVKAHVVTGVFNALKNQQTNHTWVEVTHSNHQNDWPPLIVDITADQYWPWLSAVIVTTHLGFHSRVQKGIGGGGDGRHWWKSSSSNEDAELGDYLNLLS
jgi:hypothetical protein